MITLREWFSRQAVRPLAVVTILLIVVQAGYFAYLFVLNRSNQRDAVRQLADGIRLGIVQQNRPLVESNIQMAIHGLAAERVVLCQNGNAVLAHPSYRTSCDPSGGSLGNRMITHPLKGMQGYVLYVEAPLLANLHPLLFASFLWLLLVGAAFWMLGRVKRRVERDLFVPLANETATSGQIQIKEIVALRRRDREYQQLREREAVSQAISNLVTRVVHDIRSPLATLETIWNRVGNKDSGVQDLLRGALARIRGIAAELLSREQEMEHGALLEPSLTAAISVSAVAARVVAHKRVVVERRSELDVALGFAEGETYGLFTSMNARDLEGVLSNLIDNSVEACGAKGTVTVSLAGENGDTAWVEIADDGKGIPPDLLPQLGRRPITFGKEGGSGFGLYFAMERLRHAGGSLEISSQEGKGTRVRVRMPLIPPPRWFCPAIELAPGQSVVVVDDDENLVNVWRRRFAEEKISFPPDGLVSLDSPRALETWCRVHLAEKDRALYLVDFDFGEQETDGVQAIQLLSIERRAILVSGVTDDARLLDRCEHSGVRFLAKHDICRVPVLVRHPAVMADSVLVDDDALMRATWETSARLHGKHLMAYETATALFAEVEKLPKTTAIYIDFNLKQKGDGLSVAEKLFRLGYRELFITTGAKREKIQSRFVRGVLGKEPPFEGKELFS